LNETINQLIASEQPFLEHPTLRIERHTALSNSNKKLPNFRKDKKRYASKVRGKLRAITDSQEKQMLFSFDLTVDILVAIKSSPKKMPLVVV
jgi:hypothetical protein